jgi:hypothetical protein
VDKRDRTPPDKIWKISATWREVMRTLQLSRAKLVTKTNWRFRSRIAWKGGSY